MAEDRLRELERRWKESGSEQDELAYLQEQVRTGGALDWESYSRLAELNVEAAADYLRARVERGDLVREKLELAAYCSHEPARLLLGEEAPEVPGDLEEWVRRLGRWGSSTPVHAAIASAEIALPRLDDEEARARTLGALDQAKLWLSCPCEGHAAAAIPLQCPPGGYGPGDAFKLADRVARTVAFVDDPAVAGRQAGDVAWQAALWLCDEVRSILDEEVISAKERIRLGVGAALRKISLS